jgi:hypothetical protein
MLYLYVNIQCIWTSGVLHNANHKIKNVILFPVTISFMHPTTNSGFIN